MGLIKSYQFRKDSELLAEEKLFEYVAQEVEAGEIRKGLWAKASTTAATADQADIQREYIKLRVDTLKAEGRLFQQFVDEVEKVVEGDTQKDISNSTTQIRKSQQVDPSDGDGVAIIVGFFFVVFLLLFLAAAATGL